VRERAFSVQLEAAGDRADPLDAALDEACFPAAAPAYILRVCEEIVDAGVVAVGDRGDERKQRAAPRGLAYGEAWERGGREFSTGRLPARLLADVEHGFAGGGYRSAPVLIVVAADTTRAHPATVPSSIFPAVQNLLLAAHAVGLGSALTTLTTGSASELARLLELPDTIAAQAVVPLGYPEKPLGPPRREPFADHTFRDRYGVAW